MERMIVPQTIVESLIEDEIEQAFPGCVLTHVLTVASDDQLSIAIETLQAVKTLGGRLEGLHLARRGGPLVHRLSVVGLRSHAARLLCDRLAALPGVARASVEHQILRK
jgi:hypothetical protein